MSAKILTKNVWCVVGDVLNSAKVASRLGPRLARNGKEVWLVNPKLLNSADDPAENGPYSRLSDVPASKIDVLHLCINPKVGISVVEEAIGLGIESVFIQPGAGSSEILDLCTSADVQVFDGCVLRQPEPFPSTDAAPST